MGLSSFIFQADHFQRGKLVLENNSASVGVEDMCFWFPGRDYSRRSLPNLSAVLVVICKGFPRFSVANHGVDQFVERRGFVEVQVGFMCV